MATRAIVLAFIASVSLASGASAPSEQLVASYSLAQISILLNAAYMSYGGLGLTGSTTYSVKVYRVTYSPGLIGANTPGASRSISLTGLMMVPNRQGASLPVAAFLHGTTTVAASVPSNAFNGCSSASGSATATANDPYTFSAGANVTNLGSIADFCIPSANMGPAAVFGALSAASMGYVTIVPDGIGYGGSSSLPRSYLIADDYAISTFNMLAAAITLVPNLQPGSTVGKKIVVAGYSEGGYGSLAVHRASYDARWAQAGVTVLVSYPMAGPYDLANTEFIRALTQPQTVSRPSYVLFLAYSYWINLGMSTIFSSSYTARMLTWYDGTIGAYTIDASINSATGNNFLNVFNSTMVAEVVAGRPTDFTDALKANTLVSGWQPTSGSKIRLCHAESDEVVAIANAQVVQTSMKNRGVDVTLVTISSSNSCGSHTGCAPLCLKSTLTGMWEAQQNWNNWSSALSHNHVVMGTIVGSIVVFVVVVVGGVVYTIRRAIRGSRINYDVIA